MTSSLFLLLASVVAQPPPLEQGTVRLHYVQHAIGYERYALSREGDELLLTADFEFLDRGGRVPLEARLRTTLDGAPLRFQAKGKSYRYVKDG